MAPLSQNRKAWFNYEIMEKFEAGLVLMGTEVKSLRDGKKDFATVAAKYSLDVASGKIGGDLGWHGKGVLILAVEQEAFGAKLGELTGPVKSRLGWHILRVTGRREPGRPERNWRPE